MKKVKTTSLFVAMLGLLALCGSARAVDVLEPAYVAETWVIYSEPGLSRPHGMVFANDGNLYVTQRTDDIWVITPAGEPDRFLSDLGALRGIVWAGGTNYGNYLYVAEGSTWNGQVYRIGLDAVPPFNFANFDPPDHCPCPLALDTSGSYGGYLYTATGCQDHTYRIYLDGSHDMFSDWPGWVDGGSPTDIAFDPGATYGGLMYASAWFNDSAGNQHKSGLFTLDTSGEATRFTEDLVAVYRIDFDVIGDFDGQMFVSGQSGFDEPWGIWRVGPDGAATEFATTTVSMPYCLSFGPDGAVYVAEYSAEDEMVIISRIYKANGEIYIDSCQELDQPDTVYYLDRSLSGSEVTENCMHITAENVTLDCQGHSIINSQLEAAVIYSEADYATIRNCDVQASPAKPGDNGNGKGIGIRADHNLIEDSIVRGSFWGIVVSGNENTVQYNVLSENAKAIHLGHDNNLVKNNLVINNNIHQAWGLGVWGGQYNQFINNKVYGSKYGIVLYDASHTFLKCGYVYDNSIYDIYLYSGVSDVTSVEIDFAKIYVGSGSELIELSGSCDDVDCIWEGDECVEQALTLISAVSRKAHDTAGDFDIQLPLADPDPAGVECRDLGPTEVLLIFSEPITACDGSMDPDQEVTTDIDGTPTAGLITSLAVDANEISVYLSGVPDASCLTIVVSGVCDLADNQQTGDNDVDIVVLRSDTNADNLVDASDYGIWVSNLFQSATPSNFRSDINMDNLIDASDFGFWVADL